MTMTEQPSTDEQRAEWQALSAQMRALDEEADRADQEVLSYMRLHMRGGEYADLFLEDARNATRLSVELRAKRTAIFEGEYAEHPYTAKIKARRAAKVAQ